MATSRKPRKRNIKVQLTNVQLHRNGLTVEMQGVPADQVETVAQHILDAMRSLTKRGYRELLPEGTPLHAGAFGEVPEEVEYEEARRVGFHVQG
jgi:hypothetical protein